MAGPRLSMRQKWLLHYINEMPGQMGNALGLQMNFRSPCEGMYDGELRRFITPLIGRGLLSESRRGFYELTELSLKWLAENPTPIGEDDVYPERAARRIALAADQEATDTFIADAAPYLSATVEIDPKKKRIEVHVMPELKEALLKLAKADKRSLLNYIETLLEKHVKETGAK